MTGVARMTPALRRAAMRAVLVFSLVVKANLSHTVSINHNF